MEGQATEFGEQETAAGGAQRGEREGAASARRLAAEFVHSVAAAAYRAERLGFELEAARESLDGIRSADPSREHVTVGYSDPDAIATRLEVVERLEARLGEARAEDAAMRELWGSVLADLSEKAAGYATARLGEESLGVRSTCEENMLRFERRRRRETPEERLERYAAEVAALAEIASQLNSRGVASAADLATMAKGRFA